MVTRSISCLGVLAFAVLSLLPAAAAQSTTVILCTTTSTQDSGLLDVLVPLFETQAVIKTFGHDKYGQSLFVPVAGQREASLGQP